MKDYQKLVFPFRPPAELGAGVAVRHPVIVVGAGPVGLAAAIDLARHGIRTVLLDEDDSLSTGSRAICFAKRTLEIFDRLGCGDPMIEKGVSWQVGKVFFQDRLVYQFDLLPEGGHRRPAFINLQQYYAEGFLVEHAAKLANLDIRWKNQVTGVAQTADGVEVEVATPAGAYRMSCDYLVATDGAGSSVRAWMGLEIKGQVFRDRFLIADIKMTADRPIERWFWFDPPFHRNQSALLHRQPDDIWRLDFQLGWEADPVAEKQPERVIPRVRAMLGPDADFQIEWVSIYTFGCRRMERFRHGRVLFAGDAAHVVSPFGARGANSGVQDADNLAWKLALVLRGCAPESLLDSYDAERVFAADENILNSTRSTEFITPKSKVSRVFRDAVLSLAGDYPFARRLVNSGRLSAPSTLADSRLNTPDRDPFAGSMIPGAPAADAPIRAGGRPDWLLARIGDRFSGLLFVDGAPSAEICAALRELAREAIPIRPLLVALPGTALQDSAIEDAEGLLARRYDALPGTFYLVRPDQHVCARWRQLDPDRVRTALRRATCNLERGATP
ncbi:MAG: FAD-dependent oxidoreductase [Acidobacteria bacterium]|nr:FAD-dependent oxidoreductase [Acidobacteriota bacterium]